MIDSPHFQKWVNELALQEIFGSIWIFPSDCPKTKFQSKYPGNGSRVYRFHFKVIPYLNWAIFKILDLILGSSWRSFMLARYIKILKPDTLHFHELQHGAYLFNEIASKVQIPTKIITSTWGSDILLYGQVGSHIPAIKEVLSWTNILTSERNEDFEIAKPLGFRGEFKAPIYITLGVKLVDFNSMIIPSERQGIIIKGYQDITGRALNILKAIDELGASLSQYEIYIYSTDKSPAVRVQAEIMKKRHGLQIILLDKLNHAELMTYFQKSRIYIGMAISDGLSTSMVEAMAHGVFPIQSENSAAPQFIKHGETGMILDPWDISGLTQAIRDSLDDDSRLNRAAEINARVINTLYNLDNGINRMKELYG